MTLLYIELLTSWTQDKLPYLLCALSKFITCNSTSINWTLPWPPHPTWQHFVCILLTLSSMCSNYGTWSVCLCFVLFKWGSNGSSTICTNYNHHNSHGVVVFLALVCRVFSSILLQVHMCIWTGTWWDQHATPTTLLQLDLCSSPHQPVIFDKLNHLISQYIRYFWVQNLR